MTDALAYGLRQLLRFTGNVIKAWAARAWEWINKRIPHG